MNPIKSLFGHNDAIREVRAASLRFVALAVLFANLTVGDSQASFITHLVVAVAYLVVSVASVLVAIYLPSRSHLATTFTLTDAGLVIVVLYEHIVASPISENHNLTTSSLVIAFVMLNHVAFKLNKRLVVLFSTTVISAWLVMLAVTAYRHRLVSPGAILDSFFGQELALTASFTFTAFSVYLLAKEHDRTRRIAVRTEERRLNLSRFFSPTVVADLQEASQVLDLERREAAIMFVDIRNFTSYSENASPQELAKVLAEYRRMLREQCSPTAEQSTSLLETASWPFSDNQNHAPMTPNVLYRVPQSLWVVSLHGVAVTSTVAVRHWERALDCILGLSLEACWRAASTTNSP